MKNDARDVDSYDIASKLTVNSTSLLFGLVLGGLGAAGAQLVHHSALYGFVAGSGIAVGLIQFFGRIFPTIMSDYGSRIYAPDGSSTPAPPEYSLAQSLAVRGQFVAAIKTYEDAIFEHPDDPEPCIRIARILRDSLHRYDDAVLWFRRARDKSSITNGQEMMINREIAELYMFTMRSPSKATPELARLAQKHPDTAAGEWARKNLREIKEIMRTEESSGGSDGSDGSD